MYYVGLWRVNLIFLFLFCALVHAGPGYSIKRDIHTTTYTLMESARILSHWWLTVVQDGAIAAVYQPNFQCKYQTSAVRCVQSRYARGWLIDTSRPHCLFWFASLSSTQWHSRLQPQLINKSIDQFTHRRGSRTCG